MVKKFFKRAICILTCITLVGCGQGKTATVSSSTGNTGVTEDTTISLLMYEYSDKSQDIWTGEGGIKENFEKANPHITLEVTMLPWQEAKDALDECIANEDLPDFAITDDVNSLVDKNLLLPIYGGAYASATAVSKYTLFYNKDIFADLDIPVPGTWQEVPLAASIIKENRPDVAPVSLDLSEENAPITFNTIASGINGGIVYDKGAISNSSEENKEALALIKSLYTGELLNGDPLHDGLNVQISDFVSGKSAMLLAPWSLGGTIKAHEGYNGDDIGIAKVSSKDFIMYDNFVMFNRGGDTKIRAVNEFIMFFYGEGYDNYIKSEGFLSAPDLDWEACNLYYYDYNDKDRLDASISSMVKSVCKGGDPGVEIDKFSNDFANFE